MEELTSGLWSEFLPAEPARAAAEGLVLSTITGPLAPSFFLWLWSEFEPGLPLVATRRFGTTVAVVRLMPAIWRVEGCSESLLEVEHSETDGPSLRLETSEPEDSSVPKPEDEDPPVAVVLPDPDELSSELSPERLSIPTHAGRLQTSPAI